MSPGREQGKSTTSLFDDDDDVEVNTLFADFEEEYSDEDLSELDAAELFSYIPPEIKATRLPGTVERYPFIVTLGLFLLVLLNIGAAALLVYRLGLVG